MDTPSFGMLDFISPAAPWEGGKITTPEVENHAAVPAPDPELLRRCAWDIGEQRPWESYAPADNHVGLATVTPTLGFAHWHIGSEWVEQTARQRGDGWRHCRLVLRLYDVSYIQFNGFNAHRLQDEPLPCLAGQRFFHLSRPGLHQVAEVGFLLRSGEFLPAARSQVAFFPRDCGSANRDATALLVDDRGRVEEVGNVWGQESILRDRRRPKLRKALRIAAFAFPGEDGRPAPFVTELTAQQRNLGHEVHVFLPARKDSDSSHQVEGAHYHPLAVNQDGSPLEIAQAFARAAEDRLRQVPPFDLLHLHEWMSGRVAANGRAGAGGRRRVLSLTSLEVTRRNGTPPSALSQAIQRAEREVARSADCVLTPDWLRDRAVAELGMDGVRVRPFPMEGRLANEWECSLDYGQVKMEIGVGPLDRLLLFVGPLEHAAGVDLLIEAMPTLLSRAGNLRLAFIGSGFMHGQLQHRAHQLGVAHAVRLLGHREGWQVNRLVRAAEAVVLPSRCRVPQDDAVVDLARRAARPVVTTHGGPAHLVRHEENGLVTYDNPGSMVWALDRILGNPGHAERMGHNGRRASNGSTQSWGVVARHYLDLCACCFPELTQMDL